MDLPTLTMYDNYCVRPGVGRKWSTELNYNLFFLSGPLKWSFLNTAAA
jgi:hypothetical protein